MEILFIKKIVYIIFAPGNILGILNIFGNLFKEAAEMVQGIIDL